MAQFDASVATNFPSLFTASQGLPLSPKETTQINNISGALSKHKELIKMNPDLARKEFKAMDVDAQAQLKYLFKDAAYAQAEPNVITNVGKFALNTVGLLTSPLRLAFKAAEVYNRAINEPYLLIRQVAQGEDLFSYKTWQRAWDGKELYDNGAMGDVVNQYGKARAYVAGKLLAGKTPGEILESYGTLDKEILAAMQEAFTSPDTFNQVLQATKAAQISPGRDLVRYLDDRAPHHGSLLSQAAQGKFAGLAGAIDAIYQIAVDPLTWATGGTSKAITRADKLRELALQGKTGVSEVFKDPAVIDYWTQAGPKIKEFADAKGAYAKGVARNNIFMAHEGLANYDIVDLLAKNKVFDAPSAEKFFNNAQNVHLLSSGRVVGTSYVRSGVPVARRWRQYENNIITKLDNYFNGTTRTAAETEVAAEKLQKLMTSPKEINVRTQDWSALDPLSKEVKGYKKASFARLAARHPGSQRIFTTDDKVMETLPVFNSLTRTILPKDMANFMTELFKTSSQQDRIIMLRNVYAANMYNVGLHGVPGGEELMNSILQEKFARQYGWGTTDKITVAPQHLEHVDPETLTFNGVKGENGKFEITSQGPIHPFQNAEAIGGLPWDLIQQTIAGDSVRKAGQSIMKEKRFDFMRTIGGATQHAFLKKFTDGWSFFTLYPRLGVRSSIDEAMMYLLTAPMKDVIKYASGALRLKGSGKEMSKPIQAYTASMGSIGPVKAGMYKILGMDQGPASAISAAKRRELSDMDITALQTREKIAEHATDLYRNYSDEDRLWIMEGLIHSPDMLNGMVGSLMARVGVTGSVDPKMITQLITTSRLTDALEKESLKVGSKYKAWDPQELALINNRFPAMAHYYDFFLRFARNRVTLKAAKGKTTFDPATAYIRNGAGKNPYNFERAKVDLLEQVGIIPDDAAQSLFKIKDHVLLNNFLNMSSNTSVMREMGFSDIQIARTQIDMILTDLHETFHGSPEAFNEKLFKHLHQLDDKGHFVPFYKAFNKLSFEDFEKLTLGYTPTKKIVSPIDFDGASTVEGLFAKGINKGMEQMDRQVNGIIRQDAVTITYVRLRREYSKWQKQMVEDGVRNGLNRTEAEALAAKHFTEVASKEAAERVLKYVDNPEIRSQFSFGLRTLGRFYRATEDFNRRIYRMAHDASIETLWRMRLAHLGLSASGSVFTDQQGNPYVVMPMDNVIYKATDTTLRVLGAPLGKGNVGYQQPIFNDFTFKLSMANPSFDPNAAQPTLSGPVAGLSVLAAKSMLGMFGGAKGKALGENLDNWALGQVGDNMTWTRAVVPSTLSRVWQILDPTEKSRQATTAAQQAMAYNAAHGRYLRPDATDEEKAKYLKNLRISAHNILAMRSILGLMLPVSPSMQESADVPDYLKKVKMTGLVPEFRSILDSVNKKAVNEGISDPYELALFTFIGKYPNRLVYTISRSEKAQNTVIQYSKEVKDWAIGNQGMIDTYGEVAYIFAPKVNKFDQGTYLWMQASGLLKTKKLEDYFTNIQTAVDKQRYYDIGKQETAMLEQATDSMTRSAIIEEAKNQRAALKVANPLLEAALNPKGNTIAAEANMLASLTNLVNNESTNIDPGIRTKLRLAVEEVNKYYIFAKNPALKDFGNASDLKYERRVMLEKFLDELTVGDLVMKEARRAVFDPIINYYSRNSYSVGIRGL